MSRASTPSCATCTSLAMFALRSERRTSSSSSGLSSTRRIGFVVMSCPFQVLASGGIFAGVLERRRRRDREIEGGPFPGLRVRPDAPPVLADDSLHRGQSDPLARIFLDR